MDKVVVVSVTYGNRVKYVSQIIDRLMYEKQVCKVIIVNNGSEQFDKFNSTQLLNNQKVKAINHCENRGSANGFADGLAYVLDHYTDCDYIWLLDDDNLPANDCLSKLLQLYKVNSKHDIYAGFRNDRVDLKERGYQRYQKNSFFDFYLTKKSRHDSVAEKQDIATQLLPCETLPYGGMLIPMDVAMRNGLPNRSFVLYSDDNDYTYRITKAGYQLKVAINCVIEDLESSWFRREKVPMFKGVFQTDMMRSAAYTIRNRVFFEKNNITTNKILYAGNIVVYLFFVALKYMPKNKKGYHRFRLIINMILRGWNGRLGELMPDEYA